MIDGNRWEISEKFRNFRSRETQFIPRNDVKFTNYLHLSLKVTYSCSFQNLKGMKQKFVMQIK